MNIGREHWIPSLNGHRFTVDRRHNRYWKRRKLAAIERAKIIYHKEKEQDEIKRPRKK